MTRPQNYYFLKHENYRQNMLYLCLTDYVF